MHQFKKCTSSSARFFVTRQLSHTSSFFFFLAAVTQNQRRRTCPKNHTRSLKKGKSSRKPARFLTLSGYSRVRKLDSPTALLPLALPAARHSRPLILLCSLIIATEPEAYFCGRNSLQELLFLFWCMRGISISTDRSGSSWELLEDMLTRPLSCLRKVLFGFIYQNIKIDKFNFLVRNKQRSKDVFYKNWNRK